MGNINTNSRVEGRNRGIKVALCTAFVVFAVFTIVSAEAQNYVIDDNRVYVDTPRVHFMADPHTITPFDDYIYFQLISKVYSGDISVAFGFDTDIIRPRSAEYYGGGSWNDISNSFDVINFNHGNMNRWYVLDSVNVNSGQLYNLRVDFDIVNQGNAKYWVCAKPSSQTLSEALASGNLLCLDPWISANYLQRTCWNISNPLGSDIINLSVELNLDMSQYTSQNGCNDYVFGNETDFYGFWNWTDCITTGNTTWVVRTPVTKADNTTKICLYHDNADDNVFNSSIFNAGILGDNFDDNDISDWGTGGVFGLACTAGQRPLVSGGEVYSNDIDSPCINKGLSYNTTAEGYLTYARWYSGDYRGVDWGYGLTTQDGYHGGFGRPQQQDIEVFRVDNNAGTKIGEDNTAIGSDSYQKSKIGRKVSDDKLFNKLNTAVTDWDAINTADSTYTLFQNFSLAPRDSGGFNSGRLDYILYTVWCDTCGVFGQVSETALDYDIVNPKNITYNLLTDTDTLNLDISLNANVNPIDKWWYNLNGGSDVFFIPNTTITPLEGSNSLFVYVNDTSGLSLEKNVFFTVILPPTINESITFVVEELPVKNISCEGDQLVTIRERLTGTADGTFVAFQIDRVDCPEGCSDFVLYKLGEPGCIENNFTLALWLIIIAIISVGLIRLVFK